MDDLTKCTCGLIGGNHHPDCDAWDGPQADLAVEPPWIITDLSEWLDDQFIGSDGSYRETTSAEIRSRMEILK
jgi:hypothetical protein